MMLKPLYAALVLCALVSLSLAATRTQKFDSDPDWDGLNNHVVPPRIPTVKQEFGYSAATNFAGKEKGEIGGEIWRSTTPASYAAAIPVKTLNDKLSASGTFALTATDGSSGAFFGWFNSAKTGGGRSNTLGFRFAGQGAGARLTLQLVTATNQACGTKITPWVVDKTKEKGHGRKFRPPSIKNDGTRYEWTMEYDPQGNDAGGQIHFTIRSNSDHPEPFEGEPFTIDLPKGYREHGTTFDRFGLTNSEKAGKPLRIYFDDVRHDGQTENFSKDANWIGSGNHVTFEDREQGAAHDFGYRDHSNIAQGAAAGEVGGILWRSGKYAYYADPVGPLNLDNRLEAGGKVVLKTGLPDSGMYLGFFNSADKTKSPAESGNFLGIKIGGPTHVGHYFAPAYVTATGARIDRATGPLLVPQRVYEWKMIYDPLARDGNGAITVTLGGESVTLPLKPGDKSTGAVFDRFGLFTAGKGGSYVKIYFDDLTYTATPEAKP